MKRVVVTGIGIVSSLGNNCQEVLASLRGLKSGITSDPTYREMGLRSQVAGNIAMTRRNTSTARSCVSWAMRPPIPTSP